MRSRSTLVSVRRFGIASLAAGLLAACAVQDSRAADPPADFVLREHLGRTWTRECVTFPLRADQAAKAERGARLVGADGQAVAYQLVPAGKNAAPRISLQVDLPAYGSLSYRFAEGPTSAATDLKIEQTADIVQVTNGTIGLRVRRTLKEGAGPVAGLRLASGTWTGDSTFAGHAAAIASYEVQVAARGPVFAEVACRTTFVDGGRWNLRFRIERGEPVVLVDEDCDAPGGGTFAVVLGGETFRPSHLLHRNSDVTSTAVTSDPLAGYFLEPWLHWNNPRHGTWLAVFTQPPPDPSQAKATVPDFPDKPAKKADPVDELLGPKNPPPASRPVPSKPPGPPDKADDMLALALLRPSLWVDPQWQGTAKQSGPHARAAVRDGLLAVDFAVGGGRRTWLLGALDRTGSLEILGRKNRRVAPPPQKLVLKHGDFPLDRVKDFVLEWDGDLDNHPVLYVKQRDLPELRTRLKSDPRELARWTGQQPIDKYLLDGPIKEFLASGNLRLGALMADKAEEYLATCTDWFLVQDERLTPGAAPHMQTLIVTVVNLVDPVLSCEAVPLERRRRILARLAFLGYVVSSPDYWSPERGFTGFANMTSVVALYRTALGCLLPSHPQGKAWAEQGLAQLRRQLDAWSDEDGGWIEAPHYAMVSFDHMLAGFAMAANAGFAGHAFDPRMRKVIEWFAAISTPRDSRIGGYRHQPPIGNTYHGEPTGLYGAVAALWKDRDPEFAAGMQWLFEEHGSFGGLGIGWNFPSMLGYRFLMSHSGVKPRPVELGSRLFRRTGVVLRNSMQSGRETYLHLIAGSNHEHYDVDSGSLILYGKGRVLADDWGYIGMHPAVWHSLLSSAAAPAGGTFRVETFSTSPAFDFVAGRKGAWRRQIAFAKDADPLGPNCFLIRDSHAADVPATWRLWLTGTEVAVHDRGATLVGAEDVDLDVFLYDTAKLDLKTERATQRVSTAFVEGREVPALLGQTALVATAPPRTPVIALLFPRLKTEPAPRVTWSAGGAIAQVETAVGTDLLFLAEKPQRATDPDPGTLRPLLSVARPAAETAWSYVPDDADYPSLRIDPDRKSFDIHPGPTNPVTVAWRSPQPTRVRVAARLQSNAPPGAGDGTTYELRHGAKTLAQGQLDPAAKTEFAVEGIPVAAGDLIRLVIRPRGNHTSDETALDLTVRSEAGATWDLRTAVLETGDLANRTGPGVDPAKAAWSVCEGDAERFAPDAFARRGGPEFATADGRTAFQGTAAAVRVRGAKTTLSLGAAGRIRTGGREFASDRPAARD